MIDLLCVTLPTSEYQQSLGKLHQKPGNCYKQSISSLRKSAPWYVGRHRSLCTIRPINFNGSRVRNNDPILCNSRSDNTGNEKKDQNSGANLSAAKHSIREIKPTIKSMRCLSLADKGFCRSLPPLHTRRLHFHRPFFPCCENNSFLKYRFLHSPITAGFLTNRKPGTQRIQQRRKWFHSFSRG